MKKRNKKYLFRSQQFCRGLFCFIAGAGIAGTSGVAASGFAGDRYGDESGIAANGFAGDRYEDESGVAASCFARDRYGDESGIAASCFAGNRYGDESGVAANGFAGDRYEDESGVAASCFARDRYGDESGIAASCFAGNKYEDESGVAASGFARDRYGDESGVAANGFARDKYSGFAGERYAVFDVAEIQPPHWWIGMRDSSLQLQIHGKDIRNAEFSLNYPGVVVDSVVRLDGSPNWQFIYLSIAPDAKPGKMKLEWREGGKRISRDYELRERREQRGAQGFSAADVLYMVMPDRFANGDTSINDVASLLHHVEVDRSNPNTRHGGDLKGIEDHVGYLDSLGITAVWLNPVLENDMEGGSYHGYATTDYYRVDPRFGSNGDYARLVDTLHNHGIKTVMDMIFNHSGSGHPWFEDRPSFDWFNFPDGYVQTNYRLSTITDPYATDYDRKLTQDGWFVADMPDLNQRNPHLMKYLIQNSIWWIEEAQIDGIRMDTYPYADEREMARWIDAVMAEYPNFNIVGECWFGEAGGEAYWQKGSPLANKRNPDTNLPVVMDFPLMIKSRDMAPFKADTDPWNGLNVIYDHLALDYLYPDPMNVLRFLDNHDTERFILKEPETLDQWKQAITLLLTIPGIPQIYYGTELLMHGTREGGDGNVRKDMPGGFPGDKVSVFDREGRSVLQNEAFDYIASLNKWRKTSDAIGKGSMKHFMPTNGIYLYERRSGEDSAVIVMNGRDKKNEVDMSRYVEMLPVGGKYKDVITGEIIELIPDSLTYTFAPRETRILEPVLSD